MSEVEMTEPSVPGGYSVTLPTFEGPLDLLLHLCQKHELDILDIPIGFVTEKYLEFLSVMQLMNLDLAAEYLVMAATLAHIKSKMLLPAPPPGQEDDIAGEEEDPREALIRRLLEYQKYKKAGEDLQARGVAGRDVFLRGMPIEEAVHTGLPPLAQVPLFSLVEAFQNVLTKSKIKISHDIVHERITLTDRINELVDVLRVRKRLAFEELFSDATNRFDLVITFLALLEMTKLRMTRLFQTDFQSPIYVEFSAQVSSDEDGDAPPPPPPPDASESFSESEDGTAKTQTIAEAEPEAEPVEPVGALEGSEVEPLVGDAVDFASPTHTIPSPPPDEPEESIEKPAEIEASTESDASAEPVVTDDRPTLENGQAADPVSKPDSDAEPEPS